MRKLKVLLFEDDLDMVRLLETVIRGQGYEVASFPDPTACPVYRNPKCTCPADSPCADIVITDFRMPNMDGLEFLKLQERQGCKADIANKAILSAAIPSSYLEEVEKVGCQVIKKPFRVSEITGWLEECAQRIFASRGYQPA